VGKPSWRRCANIAPSLHCIVKPRPSAPINAGPSWIRPRSGNVSRSPSSKPISMPAAIGMTTGSRMRRDTPCRDGRRRSGAARTCGTRVPRCHGNAPALWRRSRADIKLRNGSRSSRLLSTVLQARRRRDPAARSNDGLLISPSCFLGSACWMHGEHHWGASA
jgi:hypothetical protein